MPSKYAGCGLHTGEGADLGSLKTPNGHSTYTHANGDFYTGNWKDGQQSGQGTMAYANGDVYSGNWEDDENGEGTYTPAADTSTSTPQQLLYTGNWKGGKFNGRVAPADLASLQMPGGFGTYTLSSGDVYTGNWKGGYQSG